MKLMIYGASGLAKEIFDTINQNYQDRWDEIIFIDDFQNNIFLFGNRIISFSKLLDEYKLSLVEAIVGIGEPFYRDLLAKKILSNSLQLVSIVHPTAVVSRSALIGNGSYIGPFSFISSNTTISDNVVIQPHAMVGHDVEIGNSSVIGPNSAIAGNCIVGERTYIGMNACIEQKRSIGNDVIIGMSSCVTRDIPSEMIAMGYPARVIGKNENKKVF